MRKRRQLIRANHWQKSETRCLKKFFLYFKIEIGGKHGEIQRFVDEGSVCGKILPKKVCKATFAIGAFCGILIEETNSIFKILARRAAIGSACGAWKMDKRLPCRKTRMKKGNANSAYPKTLSAARCWHSVRTWHE
ncbi:MAG: hypothetical protein LBT59_01720 [Clostridiales bacterium]|jgi:hypothetical protein|nr:hypothetical protein [Clostridiales bacterium]